MKIPILFSALFLLSISTAMAQQQPPDRREILKKVEEVTVSYYGGAGSALPAAESDLIVIGEPINAQTLLSADREDIYTEFTISIESMLKGGGHKGLKTVLVERWGGTIRWPDTRDLIEKDNRVGLTIPLPQGERNYHNKNDNYERYQLLFKADGKQDHNGIMFELYQGHIATIPGDLFSSINGPGQLAMLTGGKRYLLFLKRIPETAAYSILNVYELSEKVSIIDPSGCSMPAGHIFAGEEESVLLNAVKDMIISQGDAQTVADLMEAVKRCDIVAINKGLKNGARINVKNGYGMTLLMMAAEHCDFNMVKALLAAGADLTAKDISGQGVIFYAARGGRPEIVKYLLAAGAELNTQVAYGTTPLAEAIFNNRLETAKILINAGADLKAVVNASRTILMLAAQNGDPGLINLVLATGADLAEKDINGKTALIYAVESGHIAAVQILIAAGSSVNVKEGENSYGTTPLIHAASGGNLAIVQALLAAGAKVDLPDNVGRTPLMYAAGMGSGDVVKALISAGADVNSRDRAGNCALSMAVRLNYTEIVKELLSAGAKQ